MFCLVLIEVVDELRITGVLVSELKASGGAHVSLAGSVHRSSIGMLPVSGLGDRRRFSCELAVSGCVGL